MYREEQIGPYRYTAQEGVFPLGSDALALGEFATVRANARVCDLGTGGGILLLLLAARAPNLRLDGVELDAAAGKIAQNNLTSNALNGHIAIGDLRSHRQNAGQYELVVSNPPYFPVGSGAVSSAARAETNCTLEDVCTCAARLLKNGGRFALCHRPERIADVLCALRAAGLEPKRIKLKSHSPAHAPSLLLVESVRQGNAGVRFEV